MLTAREVHELLADRLCREPGLPAHRYHELASLMPQPFSQWAAGVIEGILDEVAEQQESLTRAYHIAVAACEQADPDWPPLVSMRFQSIRTATAAQRALFARQVAGHWMEELLWLAAQGGDVRRRLVLLARPGPGLIDEEMETTVRDMTEVEA